MRQALSALDVKFVESTTALEVTQVTLLDK
jgi:hypothetical protein